VAKINNQYKYIHSNINVLNYNLFLNQYSKFLITYNNNSSLQIFLILNNKRIFTEKVNINLKYIKV